jgi:hypothetical protein
MARIKAGAGPNVTFLGHETADRLRRHMQLARAFVFAAEEDFGIAPVEAQACGTPVIAFGRGGATETVVDGHTGVLYGEQTVEAIVAAVDRFEQHVWDPDAIRRHADRFSAARFRHRFADVVAREWAAFQAGGAPRENDHHRGRGSTAPSLDRTPKRSITPPGSDPPNDFSRAPAALHAAASDTATSL